MTEDERQRAKEDFEAWLTNPITEAVMASVKALGEGARAEWDAASWVGDTIDPVLRAGLKAKEQVCNDLTTLAYEDIEAWLEQPNSE